MTLQNKIKNPLIQGTLLLTIAGILSRVIGFFYRIFLSRTIGAEGLGIYHLVFPLMALCISFSSSGIQSAISRYVAEEAAKENEKGVRLYLITGILISCSISVLLSLIICQYSDFIAQNILGEPRCAPLLEAMTYCLIPTAVHACINGYYYGKKKALIPSISQLAEQLARVLGVYIIFVVQQSKGLTLRPLDAIWGIVIGEIMGMLVALTAIGYVRSAGILSKTAKNLAAMAVPLTANRVLISLCVSFENLLIPKQLQLFGYQNSEALSIYGILTGMSLPVILFPNVLSNSISVLLLPAISEAKAKQNLPAIKKAISKTIEYGLLLGFSFTFLFLFTGDFIGDVIYKNALAGTYIKILGWICPFLYLTTLLSSILHGLGYPRVTLRINLLGCVSRILIVWFFVPVYGIRAYLFGLLISYILCGICSIWILYQKKYNKMDAS